MKNILRSDGRQVVVTEITTDAHIELGGFCNIHIDVGGYGKPPVAQIGIVTLQLACFQQAGFFIIRNRAVVAQEIGTAAYVGIGATHMT